MDQKHPSPRLLLGVIAGAALFLAFCGNDASAQAAPAPATQTIVGTIVTWKAPGIGWQPYDHSTITKLGVDVDECIQNVDLKATICVKVLDAKRVGSPMMAINRLFEKFSVDPEDRPRVALSGTRASFTFSMESGVVTDSMEIKVTADVLLGRKDKILMVMGAWTSGAGKFNLKDFDAVVAGTRLR